MATETPDVQEYQDLVQEESTIQGDVDVEDTSLDKEAADQTRDKPRDGKKETTQDREPGKSILPFSRVQRIIKADKDIPMMAKDATLLISLATEEFIKRLSLACQRLAEKDRRTIVQQKDIAHIVRRVDEFLFLEEIIGSQEPTGKRKPQKVKADIGALDGQDKLQSTLRNFLQKTNETEAAGEVTDNIVVNEDGTMYTE